MQKVAVVGGTGYTGLELLRLLVNHPEVELTTICSRGEAGQKLSEVYPNFGALPLSDGEKSFSKLVFQEPTLDNLQNVDLVFFATPNGIAMQFARQLLEQGIKVIDLAADFRFKNLALWQSWYDMEHACPDLLESAVYGLPELNRTHIKQANLVGSAGCYTTAVQLALKPVLDLPGAQLSQLVVDAKSGVSGAGRNLKASSLFSECGENFSAYGVSGHRHHPEICHSLEEYSGKSLGLTFVPHLVPMVRGIFATSYIPFSKSFDIEAMQTVFLEHYANEIFVDVLPVRSQPGTKEVRASNLCRIALHQQSDSMLIVLSVIDNLVKGASGQAIQNMNLMLGFEEHTGLTAAPVYP